MNSLAMAITSKNHTPEGDSQRKKIFPQDENFCRQCVVGHADRHLKMLLQGGQQFLSTAMVKSLFAWRTYLDEQVAQIIRQAHSERIIGGRQLAKWIKSDSGQSRLASNQARKSRR